MRFLMRLGSMSDIEVVEVPVPACHEVMCQILGISEIAISSSGLYANSFTYNPYSKLADVKIDKQLLSYMNDNIDFLNIIIKAYIVFRIGSYNTTRYRISEELMRIIDTKHHATVRSIEREVLSAL